MNLKTCIYMTYMFKCETTTIVIPLGHFTHFIFSLARDQWKEWHELTSRSLFSCNESAMNHLKGQQGLRFNGITETTKKTTWKSPKPPTKTTKQLPSWELTYPLKKAPLKMIFLFIMVGYFSSLEGKHSNRNTSVFFVAPHRLARWPTPLLGWTSEACTLCTKTWFQQQNIRFEIGWKVCDVWIFSQLMQLKLVVSTQLQNIRNHGIFPKLGNHHLGFHILTRKGLQPFSTEYSTDGINFLFWQSYNLRRLKCRCLLSFLLSEVCREYDFARCCPHLPHEFPDSLWQRGMILLMASAPVVWHSICLSDA